MKQKASPLFQIISIFLISILSTISAFTGMGIEDYLEGPLRDSITQVDYLKFSTQYFILGIVAYWFVSRKANKFSVTFVMIIFLASLLVLLVLLLSPWFGIPLFTPHLILAICICLIVFGRCIFIYKK